MELSLQTLKNLMTTDFAIDMMINVAGYLIAGTLGVLIYRLVRKDSRREPIPSPENQITVEKAASHAPSPTPHPAANRVQFIRFGETSRQPAKEAPATAIATENPVNRRNRGEIIRVARGMLKAGATHENIRKVLPISEAELSLLSTNNS